MSVSPLLQLATKRREVCGVVRSVHQARVTPTCSWFNPYDIVNRALRRGDCFQSSRIASIVVDTSKQLNNVEIPSVAHCHVGYVNFDGYISLLSSALFQLLRMHEHLFILFFEIVGQLQRGNNRRRASATTLSTKLDIQATDLVEVTRRCVRWDIRESGTES